MQSETEPVQGDVGASVGGVIEARATVDWYFGELTEQVAAKRAVSSEQVVAALASLEREARRRRDQLDERGEAVSTAGAPGEVLVIPVGTFQVLVRACGLSDTHDHAFDTHDHGWGDWPSTVVLACRRGRSHATRRLSDPVRHRRLACTARFAPSAQSDGSQCR
jgi:hypothetical protein